MINRLNFNLLKSLLLLSFVSFQYSSNALSSPLVQQSHKESSSGQTNSQDSKTENQRANILENNNTVQVEQLKTEIQKNPRDLGKTITLAKLYFDSGNYEQTTLVLWKNIEKLDRETILMLAKAHEKRNEPTEMARALNILVGKNDKDFEALTSLGDAYSLQKKNTEALESYKKAIELNDKFEPAYLGVAKLYEQRSPPNLYELRILFQDMIESIGPLPKYYQKLCDVNAHDDATAEAAIESCRKATKLEPNAADAFVNLAISLGIVGKKEESESLLKKTADKFPKSEYAQYSYAQILEEQKDSVGAMKLYKAATEADSTSARGWLGLASSSFALKKYETALIAYKNACKHDKTTAVSFRRATTILKNNKESEWIQKFESASDNCSF